MHLPLRAQALALSGHIAVNQVIQTKILPESILDKLSKAIKVQSWIVPFSCKPLPKSRRDDFSPRLRKFSEQLSNSSADRPRITLFKVRSAETYRGLELKNIVGFEERKEILQGALKITPVGCLSGKTVLLFDDLDRSGATLSSLTSVLYDQGNAKIVKVLTLTKNSEQIVMKVYVGG
jgi:predicted amidophosphoribosyltransferase